jgi:transposase-like protein
MLTDRDMEMFQRIVVTTDLLEKARIERVSDSDARVRFGIRGPASRNMSGIVFPYYSHITGRRVTCRIRRDHPEVEDGQPKNKYMAPYGDARHLYFPPGAAEKLSSPITPIALVEAEKSCLALTAWAGRIGMDLLPIALSGCWGWRGRIGKTESSNGSRVDVTGALSDLAVCDGRKVYLILDSNVAVNPKVRQAERALARHLAERGCDVLPIRIPRLDNVNGPDDCIAVLGDDKLHQALLTPGSPSDGLGILEAAAEAIAGRAYASEEERFYAFCVAMQRLRGTQYAVALPVESIAKLFGCHHTTVARWRRQLVADGLLQPKGRPVRSTVAATFAVVLPAPHGGFSAQYETNPNAQYETNPNAQYGQLANAHSAMLSKGS